MLSKILKYNENFKLFSNEHLLIIGLIFFLCIILPYLAKYYFSESRKLFLTRFLAVIISITAVLWIIIRVSLGRFVMETDLPLDLCNLAALSLTFLMWKPKYKFHEILYFLILSGTFQAILTPHLLEGFPNYTFMKYWIVHGGLVVFVIYITCAYKFYPAKLSILKTFIVLQIYTLLMFPINWLIGSNYFYIMRKPPTSSLLDYFGPWPWYIVVCEGIAVILFVIVYLPIYFIVNKSKNASQYQI